MRRTSLSIAVLLLVAMSTAGAQGAYPALDREPAFIQVANGFRLFYTDSAGPTTDAERRIMEGVPGIDVGFIPYGLERRESGLTPVAFSSARAPSRVETIRRAATTLSTERGEDGEQADNRHRNRHPRGTQLLRFREDDGDKVKRAD